MWLRGHRSPRKDRSTVIVSDAMRDNILEMKTGTINRGETMRDKVLTACKPDEPAQFIELLDRRPGKSSELIEELRPNVPSYPSGQVWRKWCFARPSITFENAALVSSFSCVFIISATLSRLTMFPPPARTSFNTLRSSLGVLYKPMPPMQSLAGRASKWWPPPGMSAPVFGSRVACSILRDR